MIAVVSAVGTLIWYLMAAAEEFRWDQRELRGWTKEISEKVDENSERLVTLASQVGENSGKLDMLVVKVRDIEQELDVLRDGLVFLICDEPESANWAGCL